MELPNDDTLKFIEKRINYLTEKNEKAAVKNGFDIKEIKALTKVINLISLFRSSAPGEIDKAAAETPAPDPSRLAGDDYEILHSFERELVKNTRLDILFIKSKNSSQKYIMLGLQRWRENLMKWTDQGKMRLPPELLKEIAQMADEMGIQ